MKWCNALDLFLAYPSSKIKIDLNEVVGMKIGGAKVIRYVILDFIDGHYVSAPTQPFFLAACLHRPSSWGRIFGSTE